ncbi:MAG: shikimate kinase [Ethanoligenens sp.]|uniref:shikimate kinase n=1 Tax=Ethanoligenens sp. TaxID=2099655 RepID=UPI0039EAA33C
MKNVVLCGFMGSGKSSVGAAMAALTGARFVDMDRYIEKQEGKRVSAIFREKGEAYFRELEKRAAASLSRQSGQIIATGGGAVMRAENVRAFRKGGVIVLLDVPLYVVQKRLHGDRSRPLLNAPDRGRALRELYKKRLPFYRAAADLVVENRGDLPVSQMAERVWQAVQNLPDFCAGLEPEPPTDLF